MVSKNALHQSSPKANLRGDPGAFWPQMHKFKRKKMPKKRPDTVPHKRAKDYALDISIDSFTAEC